MAAYARRLRQAQGLAPGPRRPRQTLPHVAEPGCQPLTPRRASWLGLRRETQRTAAEAQQRAQVRAQQSAVRAAMALAQECGALVRQRRPEALESGLKRARSSALEAWPRFATGLSEDYEAVKAGVPLPWRSGPGAGHSNRLKRLKRQMVGRARLALLSRRFLLAPRQEQRQTPRAPEPGEPHVQPAVA